MTEPDEIVFEPKDPFIKIRRYGGPITYEQNGHVFSAAHVYLGPAEKRKKPVARNDGVNRNPKPKRKKLRPPKPTATKESIGNKLKGYTPQEAPDHIRQAQQENAKALHAEENAE